MNVKITIICFFLLSSTLFAQNTKYWRGGMLMGNDYLSLSESEKDNYVIGVFDGLIIWQGTPNNDKLEYRWFNDMAKEMLSTQIRAIFDKYLEKNAGIWHYPANILFLSAMKGEYEKIYGVNPYTNKPPKGQDK